MLAESQLIYQVESVKAHKGSGGQGEFIHVSAAGFVNSSGWSAIDLSERFYIDPPDDGIWDIDFVGSPPGGIVLPVISPVCASVILGAPDWVKGIRIHARTNQVETSELGLVEFELASVNQTRQLFGDQLSGGRRTIFRQSIAVYDDSFQPTGFCGGLSIKMKKLRHELFFVAEGPDEDKIRNCLNEALGAGAIAGIAAVFITGGAALAAAISAALSQLRSCLGSEFEIKFERKSHWIEWCT